MLNLVLGDASTGKALVAHPAIRMISLTGDVAAGKAVAGSGARPLKRIGLELGGKAPVLVFNDSPFRETARDLVEFGYSHSGQDCTAACRITVEDAAYDEFVEAYCEAVAKLRVGDSSDPETEVGPLISERQLNRGAGFVDRARDNGATVRIGGQRLDRPDWFYAPTVLTDADQSDEIIQREVFGPVITIQRGHSEPISSFL